MNKNQFRGVCKLLSAYTNPYNGHPLEVSKQSILRETTIIMLAFMNSVLGRVDNFLDRLMWNSAPFFSQEWKKDLAECCLTPGIAQQLSQGQPKHAQNMINLETLQDHFVFVVYNTVHVQ